MSRIGESLRNARLAKGVTFEQIEADTKIRRRYLEALENENWHVIPGTVYLKGFIRTYSRYLEIDENDILGSINMIGPTEPEAEPLPQKIELPSPPRRKYGFIIAALAICILLVFQYAYTNYFSQLPPKLVNNPPTTPGENNGPLIPNENTPGPVPGNTQIPEVTASEINSLTLVVNAIGEKCWLQVKEGQRLIYEGIIFKGEEKIFPDLQMVSFTLGNSGAVRINLNEKDLGILGKTGEVINKVFVLENNEIKEIPKT